MIPGSPRWRPVLFDQRQRVFPGFARMDHDGLARVASHAHLLHKNVALHVAGRKVVVIIESDFAQRHHLGMPQQLGQTLVSFRPKLCKHRADARLRWRRATGSGRPGGFRLRDRAARRRCRSPPCAPRRPRARARSRRRGQRRIARDPGGSGSRSALLGLLVDDACAHRDIFEEARQHRRAISRARRPRSCPAIPGRAAFAAQDWPRSPPCAPPEPRACRPRRFPPRCCAAAPRRYPRTVQKLIRALHGSGGLHHPTRRSTLAKSSMVI